MSGELKRAVRGNLWIGIGNLGVSVCAILSYGFAVGRLGEANAGILGIVSALLAASVALGGLGFAPALTREASMADGDAAKVKASASVATTVAVLLGLICCAALYFGAGRILAAVKFHGDFADATAFCLCAGISLTLNQMSGVQRALIQARCDFRTSSTCDLAYGLLQGGGTIIGLMILPKLATVGWTNVLAAAVQVILYTAAVRKSWGQVFLPGWSREGFRRLWGFGKWMHLGNLFGILGDTFDKILLGTMFGSASVPAYAMARRFYSQCHSLLSSQAYYLFPKLSASGGELDRGIENRLVTLISLVAAWVYSGVFLAGPVIVALTSGIPFAEKLSGLLVMFCFIGWIHAFSLVTYFRKLAGGHSGLVSITHVVAGPIALSAMWILGLAGGWKAAVCGQFAILLGLAWLLALGDNHQPSLKVLASRLALGIPAGIMAGIVCLAGWWVRTRCGILHPGSIATSAGLLILFLPAGVRLLGQASKNQDIPGLIARMLAALPLPPLLRDRVASILGCPMAVTGH